MPEIDLKKRLAHMTDERDVLLDIACTLSVYGHDSESDDAIEALIEINDRLRSEAGGERCLKHADT